LALPDFIDHLDAEVRPKLASLLVATSIYKAHELAFFVHGFAKNDRDNIAGNELAALKLLASQMLSFDDQAIAKAVESGTLIEVTRY
jgi:hypothetical protein